MGKKLYVLAAITLMLGVLAGCAGGNNNGGNNANDQKTPPTNDVENQSSDGAADGQWRDGVYYAEAADYDEHSGWKEIVGLRVEGGKITEVNWNALNKEGGLDKKESSRRGIYGMQAKGGAQAEWHEQAAKAEQFLIDSQDPAALTVNDDGKTDAVSGVSVTVGEFVTLVNEALAAGPVEAGPYKDGTYYAEEPQYADSGWKYNATITVLGGNIIAADWNGAHKDGGADKDTQSKDGTYGMAAKGGAQSEWHEQAYLAEQYLIETQDPAAIVYTDDAGHTDAISGVSIHVIEFFELAEEALEAAK